MKIKNHILPLFVLLTASTLHAQVLIDTFTSGTSGSLPASGASPAWYLNSASQPAGATYTQGVAGPGSLSQTFATDQSVTTYFSGQTFATPGDTLTLALEFNIVGAADVTDGIRIALLNSNGSQISANTGVTDGGSFTGYNGYGAFFDPGSASTSPSLDVRTAGSNDTLIATGSPFNSLGTPTIISGSPFALSSNTDLYIAELSLTYLSSSSVLVALALTDATSSEQVIYDYTTSSVSTTSFDTIVIGGLSGATTSLALNDVVVTFTAVPEPPVYVLCAGGLAVFAGAWWRRRRARS